MEGGGRSTSEQPGLAWGQAALPHNCHHGHLRAHQAHEVSRRAGLRPSGPAVVPWISFPGQHQGHGRPAVGRAMCPCWWDGCLECERVRCSRAWRGITDPKMNVRGLCWTPFTLPESNLDEFSLKWSVGVTGKDAARTPPRGTLSFGERGEAGTWRQDHSRAGHHHVLAAAPPGAPVPRAARSLPRPARCGRCTTADRLHTWRCGC